MEKDAKSAEQEWSNTLVFFVNGDRVEVDNPDPSLSLSEYLRDGLALTSSKVGCGQGLCGACTVMVSETEPGTNNVKHRSVNACLFPVVHAHHKAITTLEGLGTTIKDKKNIHPIQERFSMAHASQCGFCTPGMVMSFYTLLRNNPGTLTEEMIKQNVDGNYCRCTGYRPILDAMRSFTNNSKISTSEPEVDSTGQVTTQTIGLDGAKLHPLDLSSEKIFPPYLLTHAPSPFKASGDVVTFYAPRSLSGVVKLAQENPNAVFVSGNSRKLVAVARQPTTFISLSSVAELQNVSLGDDGAVIGGAVSISRARDALGKFADSSKGRDAGFRAIQDHWRWIAGTQVRNIASVAGSLCVGHIWGGQESSDAIPLLVITNSEVTLLNTKGESRVVKVEDFIKGGNKVDLKEGEFIVSIRIPFSQPNEFVNAYKQSNRRVSSYSDVTGATRFLLTEDSGKFKIKEASLCFGGLVAAKRATKTEAALVGLDVSEITEKLPSLFSLLKEEYPEEDRKEKAPGQQYPIVAALEFRQAIICGFLFKSVSRLLAHVNDTENDFPLYHAPVTVGRQKYTPPTDGEGEVYKPHRHHTGTLHATGEAIYGDDIETTKHTLYAALVLAPVAHAKLLGVDTEAALAMKGVVAYYDAKDLVLNICEPLTRSESFAGTEIHYHSQPVGVVVANTKKRAERAALAVKVKYEELPAIVSIKDAIAADSFYPANPMFDHKTERGDVEAALKDAPVTIEGEFEIGGAIHWYMEPHTTYAIPREDGGLFVHASTQGPAWLQSVLGLALGLPMKDIVVQTKRIGGGFGGKATCFFSHIAAALAAHKLGKPVKLTLDRHTDMLITGPTPPHFFKYKLGATNDGKILGLDFTVYTNSGAAAMMPPMMLGETLHHADNAYNWPTFRGKGLVAKTNLPPTRPYRGAGVPQGVLFVEFVIDHLATKLGIAPHLVREMNLLKQGDTIVSHDQVIEDNTLRNAWFQCRQQADFDQRRKEVDLFNAANHYKKRGLSIVPSKYGLMAKAGKAFMKTSAMVSILADGTVLCHHGGIEMGQGIQIKMSQICATVLGVDISQVYIPAQNVENIPQGGVTGGSATTEVNGMAVMAACETLKKRLEPLRNSDAMKGKSWPELIMTAGFMRIDLTATGWSAPEYEADESAFKYFVWGAGATEVEVDLLSGTHSVLRVDIVQDAGRSLNPAVDMGQSEGAFVQGMGWFTVEDIKFDSQGRLDVNYDIPMADNIPHQYNVSFLAGGHNSHSIFSAKGLGEPPLCLASSVPLAIKDAIVAARREQGVDSSDLVISAPLTAEQTRLHVGDLSLAHIATQGAGTSKTTHK
eukprot:TRINITY_DN3023_c0_g1_i3.p1 TRINITY_DN3023_c0_g1~~TRINITY_DN3023_c0_g1_i3.p1  ORF type:complete len:1326 (+),score=239.00 TRINITY_DN3023_c0_g1_i3:151-4128(+)